MILRQKILTSVAALIALAPALLPQLSPQPAFAAGGEGRDIAAQGRSGAAPAGADRRESRAADTAAAGLDLQLQGGDAALEQALRQASLLVSTLAGETPNAQDVFGAARADYARLLGALYAEGHYSGVISIQLDGREAAAIPPLDAPARIESVRVTVTPGPRFHFTRADIAPLAPGTTLPEDYRLGARAKSSAIIAAAQAGVEGWRAQGHAKADIARQDLVADHRSHGLSADLALAPGPRVSFGQMRVSGNQRTREDRIRKIAGFPTGAVFDPKELTDVAARLRRTGAFRAVSLREAERLGPGNSLDYELILVEEKRRRLNFGIEMSSQEGLALSGYWLHRNLFGGAEKLRIDGAISGLGGETGGEDYAFGIRLDRPGTPFRDSSAFVSAGAERKEQDDYTADTLNLTFGLTRYISDQLTGELGLGYESSDVTAEPSGEKTRYRQIILPFTLTYDSRDSLLDATDGLYLQGKIQAFNGIETTGNGARLGFDARAYHAFGESGGLVAAGRVQGGSILGASLEGTPRDYLFYSGGGGTVRGQPYESLGVHALDDGSRSGGQHFLALSGELRARVSSSIGVVAFYDAGYVGAGDLRDQSGDWHAGAGLGLRYLTGLGPIRADIAAPVSGDTGSGMQVYIGIGQAF